jgi:Domain of unknown function (DUF4340)
MNRKQLVTLLVLVVVLGAAGLLIQQRGRSAYQGAGRNTGQKLLGVFPYNDVAHVLIKQGSNEVNLVKKDNLWRVRERYDYPANFADLSRFLVDAADLKAAQSEQAGPSQLSRLELVPGQGSNAPVVVDFRDQNDKPINTLLLGKRHFRKSNSPSPMGDMGEEGYPDGRWVKAGSSGDTVALISATLDNIAPKPDQWLGKDFFKAERIKSVAVTYAVETNSFKVSRDTETASDWKLADAKPNEQLDSSKVSGFSYALSSPSFSDVLPGDAKPEQTGLDKPTVVTLETFDNFTYTLKVGAKTNDNCAMTLTVAASLPTERTPGKDEKAEDKARLDKEFADNQKKAQDKLAQEKSCEKWIYLISSSTLESVLKERGQLLVEKKEEPKEGSSTNAVDTPKIGDPAPKAGETNGPAQ